LRIIVTGGAGFIGSHVGQAYRNAGHEVLVIDNLWSLGGGRREHVPEGADFVELDVRDPSLADVCAAFRPDVINHHAAQHSVSLSARDPEHDAQVNILGLLNVLRAALRSKVRKVIFASSGATFGNPESLPIVEETPQHPLSPYAITKLASEGYLRFFAAEHGLDFTAFRYANVYGPRQDPAGEAGVVSIFLGKFLAREGVRIDWDGEQTRDYIYVSDVAVANVRALERGPGRFYVLGTGVRTSVNQIYEELCRQTGFKAPLTYGPKRSGDTRDNEFDASLARRELDWEAKVSLAEGIARMLEEARAASAAA
jgi:UDP-glucose 4-epimerase